MGDEVENCIKGNIPWLKLPRTVKQLLGNSQKEYEKMVVEYSVKNQIRFKNNLIKQVRKNEEQYYELLMDHSRTHLMLYPYHLSDIIARELRTTPFQYYLSMMIDLMTQERSYDSLPNFTAADCLRLLGIGRNQYIDIMNQCRSSKKLFRKRPIKEILPNHPVEINIEPWWTVQCGNVMEEDIRACNRTEKDIIDILYDEGVQMVGTLDAGVVQKLYFKGLIYIDVPVNDDDYIVVLPLDGFVMNRVLGDYFETLLYKIFVAIDEHTSVAELASILQIQLPLVKGAISVFCRLGFVKKKVTGIENLALHVTWAKHMPIMEFAPFTPLSATTPDRETESLPPDDDDHLDMPLSMSDSSWVLSGEGKRLGFIFDSTLTAFLMMGNLSANLKTHAVTLFEVGKLSEEALASFVDELSRVASFAEGGEAQRYFEHAQVLRDTINFIRESNELDLLRCESLMSLDFQSRLRVLRKNYSLVISMAPLSNEITPLNSSSPPHLGPAIAEINSPWFRLFLYETLGQGPVSILITKGTRLSRLPRQLRRYKRILLCTWSHDPGLVFAETCLPALNDALQHSALFLQGYCDSTHDAQVVHIPFPSSFPEIVPGDADAQEGLLEHHPSVRELSDRLSLQTSCGYVTLLREQESQPDPQGEDALDNSATVTDGFGLPISFGSSSSSLDPRKLPSYEEALDRPERYSDWTIFDCVYGIPLFDRNLNRKICANVTKFKLFSQPQRDLLEETNRKQSLLVLDFIQRFQSVFDEDIQGADHKVPYPVRSLMFDGTKVIPWDGK